MSWLDRTTRAALDGFEFLTDSHDAKGGRRLVVKEFPGAEECETEDLGAKAWDWRLNAYFIGPDYDLAREKFLTLLNTPGAKWLQHPWRGRIWVRPHTWSLGESNDKGGYCTVSIDFVPGGGHVTAATIDRADVAAAAIVKLSDTAQARFDLVPMSASSMTNMVAKVQGQLEKMRSLISLATLPLTMANQARSLLDSIKNEAGTLLAVPGQYAAALRSFADLLGSGSAASTGASASGNASVSSVASSTATQAATQVIQDTALPQAVSSMAAMINLPMPAPGGVGDSPALRINMQREADLRGQLLLAGAAQLALADYRAAEDRDAALGSVLAAMDGMLPAMSDDVFQAALDCRATLIDALLAQQLEPAQVRDIVRPLPATVLAHRMGIPEDVFLARNRVRHPLFVVGRVYG